MTTTDEPLGASYRKLWVASAISNLGDGVRWTALPLLGASITRDPAKIAAIDLFSTLPWMAIVAHPVINNKNIAAARAAAETS